MKYHLTFVAFLLFMAMGLTSCWSQKNSHGGPVMDYISLIDSLRAAGATVEPVGEVLQPFFSVKGQNIKVNGGEVQVFEYRNTNMANAEAELVSPNGQSVNKHWINWTASPHFYNRGKLIVLYVGDSTTVIKGIEAVLGQQFAGK